MIDLLKSLFPSVTNSPDWKGVSKTLRRLEEEISEIQIGVLVVRKCLVDCQMNGTLMRLIF